MVTFWSLDLTSPLAGILVYTFAGLMLLLFYLKVVPWIDRGNHTKVRMFLEATVIVIVITDILSFIIYPPAWSMGLINDIFVYRQIPNGAHASSYVMVLSLVVIGFLKWDDALKGLMYAGLMVFIHEGMWFVPYYVTNWGDLNIPLDMAFVMWLLCITYISQKMYHLKVSFFGYFAYGGFLIGWFLAGFDITVKNTSRVFFRTLFYDSFSANATEVTSWILVTAWFVYSLKLNGEGWKWLQTFKSGFPVLRRLNMGEKTASAEASAGRLSHDHHKRYLAHVLIGGFIMLALVINIIPITHAYTVNSVNHNSYSNVASNLLSITVSAVGDRLILSNSMIDGASSGKTDVHITGVTDNQGNTWVLDKALGQLIGANCFAGNCEDVEIWHAVASGTGTASVTASFSNGANSGGNMFLLEAVGFPSSVIGTASGTCLSPCALSTVTTSSSVAFAPATDFPVGAILTNCQASNTLTAGTGYIGDFPASVFTGAIEYGNFASPPTSPTSFPWSCSIPFPGNNLFIGVVYGAVTTTTTTMVVAPGVYSLNYWLFPFLFLGMYDSLYLASGLWSRVSTKGMIWLLITGFVVGSMIAVIMGMLGIQLVVLSILALLIWWWRIH